MAKRREKLIEFFLLLCSSLTVLTTIGIISILLFETIFFFNEVSIVDFLTDTQWTPLFSDKHYGILPLLCGTLLTTSIALAIAGPAGIIIAVYLNEYANKTTRNFVKPSLEIISSVPTVVFGYFALLALTPALQTFIPNLPGFNALSAGLMMGIMIIPLVASLSEDAIYSLPRALREGAYTMGATRLQAASRVLIPAATSGITAAMILAMSRAIGETMIVAIAAGQQANFTFNPLSPVETITTYIVQVSAGDVEHGSLEYKTIFAVGFTLFVFTFLLNNISFWVRKKFKEQYE